MGARNAPGLSQDGDAQNRTRFRLFALARFPALPGISPLRPPPFAVALVVVLLALAFLGALTYAGAREFSRRSADDRAGDVASSFARHSGRLATGDAFDGYLQILRYADDPLVRARATPREEREDAMRRLLYLNTNDFASLTVADRAGFVLATTDPAVSDVRESEAFLTSRANLGPANSDIVLGGPGEAPHVDFAMTLKDPAGDTWGVIVARAHPARLWTATIFASLDNSRNVIINSEGRFAAGVPDALVGEPWSGVSLNGGAIRADLAGVSSICGLNAIARDTQIDRGWTVASCIPLETAREEVAPLLERLLLVSVAGFVLAAVVAAGLLRFGLRAAPPLLMLPPGRADSGAATVDVTEPEAAEATSADEAGPGAEVPLPAASVDARRLIEAYEARNARLSARLRETLQARLLIAATRADESYRLAGADAELSSTLHTEAMSELENLRERDLRGIGQELYPGLVRLGLPAAMKALRKEFADLIDIRLDVDAAADSVDGLGGRAPIDPGRRIVLYRLAQEAARAFSLAGAPACTVALRRFDGRLTLSVTADAGGAALDRAAFDASALAVEAFGGALSIGESDGSVAVTAEFPG